MSIIFKLTGLTLLSLGLQVSAVNAQALRPGAPAQTPQAATQAKATPQPTTSAVTPTAPSMSTLPPASPAVPSNQGQPAAVVTPAPVPSMPLDQQAVSAPAPQSKAAEANPFIPSKQSSTPAQQATQPGTSPTNGQVGQTLGAPGAVQPNFNGQFPISTAQPGGAFPESVESEEKVHPVIERGTFIGKVNGKPIYKAPREYYFDKPGADVIYKPKQEVAPVSEQTTQPGQRGSRPGQRTTNTNR